ncbi:MAG: ribosomal protein S18-alanine N-acetyltransferase [Gammaproteobacteria bacterium]
MAEELSFRLMDESDLDAVCDLEARAYEFPWSRAIIGGCTTVPYRIWLGFLPGESTHISQAFLSITLDEAHILNLSVEPGFQGRGFGGHMLNHLKKDAREQGARQMFLEVRESNRAAMQMYLNHGFNEVGRRRNYYPTAAGREDALVYGLQLRFDQI